MEDVERLGVAYAAVGREVTTGGTGPGGTGVAVRFSDHEEWTLDEGGRIVGAPGSFHQAEYDRQVEFGVGGWRGGGPSGDQRVDPR